MPKRTNDLNPEEPQRKRTLSFTDYNHVEVDDGEILTDIRGQKWIVGKPIGIGGFGVIHEVSEMISRRKDQFVVKIERHNSGPLFTEINCYLRIAQEEMISEWKTNKGQHTLGIPNYVSSGSHISKNDKYRFLILPKYEGDLQKILQEKKKFNLKTVLLISSQVLYVLEYIHTKGYIHSDIKAANIMLSKTRVIKQRDVTDKLSSFSKSPVSDSKYRYPRLRNCKARKLSEIKPMSLSKKRYDTRQVRCINYNEELILSELLKHESSVFNTETTKCDMESTDIEVDQLYLLDFGLAAKYRLSTGQHKQCEDERKAHAGTLLFCSRDAHKGMPSRRSDLESLAYNMIYWLTGSLPWIEDLENPELVQRKKRHCFVDPMGFLYFCMPDPPRIFKEFFQYIKNLDVQDSPDYMSCQQFIKKALREHGYNDEKLDFDNTEGWGIVKRKTSKKLKLLDGFKRPPLLSNMPIKPKLRDKIKSKKVALIWSKMLSNPEVLLKRVREKRTDNELVPSFSDFNLESMHPTPAMCEVYQKYKERNGQSPSYEYNESKEFPEGYTPAMIDIWKKIMEQKALDEAMKPSRKKRQGKRGSKKSDNYVGSVTQTRSKTVPSTKVYCLRG